LNDCTARCGATGIIDTFIFTVSVSFANHPLISRGAGVLNTSHGAFTKNEVKSEEPGDRHSEKRFHSDLYKEDREWLVEETVRDNNEKDQNRSSTRSVENLSAGSLPSRQAAPPEAGLREHSSWKPEQTKSEKKQGEQYP